MQNLKRLFIINNGDCSGWTNSTRTRFVIEVNYDTLRVVGIGGRDMYAHEINTAFGRFLQEYEKEYGEKVALSQRKDRYRFVYRSGSSGCQDTFIEYEHEQGFPQRKFLMHESCFGKCSGFTCWVYDFMDLCRAGGFLKAEDGNYVYRPEDDACSDLETMIIKPRLTYYEEGWNDPHDTDLWAVVPLHVVREVPEPDPEEEDTAENPDGPDEPAEADGDEE